MAVHLHISFVHCLITFIEVLLAWIPLKFISAKYVGKSALADAVYGVL